MKGHMKRKVGLKSWAMLLAGAFVLGSCVEDEVLENNEDLTPREAINFDAVVEWPEDYIEGRGAVIEKANLSSFNVWATLTRDASVEGAPIAYFSDVVFSKQGTENRFTSATTYYWPGEGPTLDFVAVGGRPSATAFTAQRNSSTNKVESFTYTVPVDATLQNDVVVAKTDPIPGNNTALVPLDFQHIMSQVNVKIGTTMTAGTINSITFSGIKNTGTYNVASPAWTFAQSPTTNNYPVTFADDDVADNTGYSVANKASGTSINASNASMMLIPQSFTTDDSRIIVNFTYEATNKTVDLEASLKGQEWVRGKVYNYYLNIEPDFTISIDVVAQPWELIAFTNEFSNTASVNADEDPTKDGRIKWTEGSYRSINLDGNGDDVNKVTLFDDITKPAEFKFTVAGPLGGTWKALLITKKGNPYAFTLDKTEGPVGETAVVKISAAQVNNSKFDNEAELRIIVDQGGQILPVNAITKDRINYTIVQPIAVPQS